MNAEKLQEQFSQLDESQQVEFLKSLMPEVIKMMQTNPVAMMEIMAACQEQMQGMDMSNIMTMMGGGRS
ncbi:hypothetical protein [Desulfurispira natronophila]|uniref:Short-subunit dehydrogenase n=1 Tax=Desulfurispira natronophila TaxID=682562 RepID=A0A7W7Y5K0_9BACT|nr:hypothetical protein [Desulfurispira natronophila]MBB5022491.1 short-subunit dehydrogenase [Desulfurispira natronophila]